MASTHSDMKIRAFKQRAAELHASTEAMRAIIIPADDPALAWQIGRTHGVSLVVLRLAELLEKGGLPVSLLQLIEREADALVLTCRVPE